MISQWYRYLVEKAHFEDVQLYDTRNGWESAARSLSFEDPKFAVDTLDAIFALNSEGKRNYLLFLHENPTRWLIKLKLTSPDEVYSCFVLGFNFQAFLYTYGIFHKISREKHVELADYFAKLQRQFMLKYDFIKLQQGLPYLEVASLIKDKSRNLDTNYSKRFTSNIKTLELLDIIGASLIEAMLPYCHIRTFNWYLLKNPNWDEAVDEHFHYYISMLILRNCWKLTKEVAEYIGISIEIYNQKVAPIIQKFGSYNVECTLDKIPRHQKGYFKIFDNSNRQTTDPFEHLEIVLWGSMFNDKTVDIDYKKDFAHYMLKRLILIDVNSTNGPIFVNLARLCYKNTNRRTEEIEPFLYFERLVYDYFSGLIRMDLEKGFQKILAGDSFSTALKDLIVGNFRSCELPFTLANLKNLEKEMFKYNPEMALWLQLKTMPIKALLKAIYETLGDPCADLRLVLTRHLFNAQLSSKSLA